jgi:hypothetical protein
MLGSEAQFSLAQQSLAADRDRLRPAIISSTLCLCSTILRPIHDPLFEIVTTMRDVPDKARHEMTVGARHRFSALDRAFRYHKAASKSLYQTYTGDLNREINRLRWSDPSLPEDLLVQQDLKGA